MAKHRMQVLVNGVPTNLDLGVGDSVESFFNRPDRVQVGDAVYVSGERVVAKASSSSLDQVCIGLVLEVEGRRNCKVIIQGVLEEFSDGGLQPGFRYFLTPEPGVIAPYPPKELGHVVQCVGIAVSSTDILVIPDLHRVVLRTREDNAPVLWNTHHGYFEV